MTLPRKILILVLFFAAPMAALAVYFVLSGLNKDLRFAESELQGNHYQWKLQDTLQLVLQHRSERERGSVDSSAAATHARLMQSFGALATVQQQAGEDLQITPDGLARRQREHVLPATIRSEAAELGRSPISLATGSTQSSHAHLITDLRTLITQ
ncbi:MAG: hypothetical protein H7039_24040, partial [Bryobacteraceae bacterium]|nr:hypothetical protein [Bryobacteraceae bacterium]